ncbi:hypothetical protein AAG570_005992 [Ranatra chinensis]|uniref:Uncharacterized protein n=1 Tax=Ranatra chinensis TaxID=642074 RepID=A0ABD0XWR8_9HEMI
MAIWRNRFASTKSEQETTDQLGTKNIRLAWVPISNVRLNPILAEDVAHRRTSEAAVVHIKHVSALRRHLQPSPPEGESQYDRTTDVFDAWSKHVLPEQEAGDDVAEAEDGVRSTFYENKKQETTEIGTCNLPPFCDRMSYRPAQLNSLSDSNGIFG